MRRALWIAVVLLLTGCAHVPPQTDPQMTLFVRGLDGSRWICVEDPVTVHVGCITLDDLRRRLRSIEGVE